MIKIFIVEDQKTVRDTIRSLIEKEPGVEIVEMAYKDVEAIEKISEGVTPDIMLTTVDLSDSSVFDLPEKIRSVSPDTKVLFLAKQADTLEVRKALQSGAHGYLLKNISRDELLFAIRHTASGLKYVSADVAVKIILEMDLPAEGSSVGLVELSKRESEVLLLIAEGLTNNEIANRLFTSRRTVEGHRQKLLGKTGTRNTAALIRFAVTNKLVK